MKRDEKEIEALADELPLKPSADIVEIIKKRQKSNRLVYRVGYVVDQMTGLKTKAVKVSCTSCGDFCYMSYAAGGMGCGHNGGYVSAPFGFYDDRMESIYHGNSCICPMCGCESEALYIGRITNNEYEMSRNFFVTIHNIRGHLVALSWIVFKYTDKEANVKYQIRRYEGVATIGNRPIRYTGYKTVMFNQISWEPKWIARKIWCDKCDEYDPDEIFIVDSIDDTDASHSAFDVFVTECDERIRIGAYIKLWTKYPNVENLVRSHLSPFVGKLIAKSTIRSNYTKSTFSADVVEKHLDVKKVRPTEMLRLEKGELPLANKYKISTIDLYRDVKAIKKIRLTDEQLKVIESFGSYEIRRLLDENVKFVQCLNYLERQRKTSGGLISVQYLYDYWNMLKDVQGSIPEELRYPKDLIKSHDRLLLMQKEKIDRAIDDGIKNTAMNHEWMTYIDDETGIMIRPAKSQEEMIKEGKYLSHCVGTYAKAVSRGETCILFIRHVSEPNIPYFTLEYRNGEVRQNRGKNNCERTEEVKIFEGKWITFINSILEAKNEKYNRASEQYASA